MVRVGVHTSAASANVSSEILPHFQETVHAAVAATASHPPFERHQSSQSRSGRNTAEVWKGQLTKSLSRRKELLVNPLVQNDVVVATPEMLRARVRFVLSRPESPASADACTT